MVLLFPSLSLAIASPVWVRCWFPTVHAFSLEFLVEQNAIAIEIISPQPMFYTRYLCRSRIY